LRRLLLLVLAILVAAPAATAAHHPKKKPKPKPKPVAVGFKAAMLAGTWAGTWNNQTFNTSGTLTLTISSADNALGFSAAITGNTFGCTAPGPQTFTLPAGAGANHWTAQGFAISNPNAAFGTMNVTYAWPAGTLTGSGNGPACATGISWTLDGAFTATTFNATAHITLPGGSQATTVVSLAKK
jgi:hypothetical protein